jgi:uncharacterized membrane protein YeaQ/YmgE (transglycosylase-associated protein family)
MNPFIWCGVGALVGWLSTVVLPADGHGSIIESLLVGIFGAFLGGDLVVTLMHGGVVNDKDFQLSSLGLAVAGAVLSVLLLKLMRRAVGAQHKPKAKSRNR